MNVQEPSICLNNDAGDRTPMTRSRRRAASDAMPQASRSGSPLGSQPAECAEKWISKTVERSDSVLPIFQRAPPGTPKGLDLRGRLLLLTFLGGARKVSGCRAAPGAPSRPEKDRTRASTSACSKTRLPNTDFDTPHKRLLSQNGAQRSATNDTGSRPSPG